MDDTVLQQVVVCIAIAGAETYRLRALRKAAGLTQEHVAARSGVTQETISRLERGCHTPQETTLRKVAHALGVSTNQILAVEPAAEVTVCVDVRGLPRSSAVFRERLVTALTAGFPRREAVRHFDVSPRTIARWVAQHRAGQSLVPQSPIGRPSRLSPAQLVTVREMLLAHPDATLIELADRVAAATGVRYSPSHLCRIRRRLSPRRTSPA